MSKHNTFHFYNSALYSTNYVQNPRFVKNMGINGYTNVNLLTKPQRNKTDQEKIRQIDKLPLVSVSGLYHDNSSLCIVY